VLDEQFKQASSDLVSSLREMYKDWDGVSQFNDTENRLIRLFDEFCWPPDKIETALDKHFKATFPHQFDEMLVSGPFKVFTLCPHHLVHCELQTTIAYVPSDNKVLGLSKFIRIAETMARRPILQEQFCNELACEFEKRLHPKGVAVYVVGKHGCMTSRGVRQHSRVTTSVLKGTFETQAVTRAEFFAIARNGKVE